MKMSVLFVLLILIFCSLSPATALSLPDPRFFGTVSSEDDLKKIGAEWPLDGVYSLESDIFISGSSWACIGYSNFPFTGEFEGNGHEIIFTEEVFFTQPFGPTIDDNSQGYGFFGNIRGDAKIKNLTLVFNGNITNRNDSNVAPFVGIASNGTDTFHYKVTNLVANAIPEITNCSVIGNGSIIFGDSRIGGFAGTVRNCNITNCSSDFNTIAEEEYAGGFIGYIYQGNISDCSATGTSVSNNSENLFVGGFNENYGSTVVNNSYDPDLEYPDLLMSIDYVYPKYLIWSILTAVLILITAAVYLLFIRKKN